MGTSESISAVEVLALLTLPDLDHLTDAQTRGAVCVWDRAEDRLTAETAIDLGEHMSDVAGTESPMRWYPRACRYHIGRAALRALHEHAPMCEPCVDDAERCETGRALRRLVRDGHRGTLQVLDRLREAVLPCEPCMKARIFGGTHECTGSAGLTDGACPCCLPSPPPSCARCRRPIGEGEEFEVQLAQSTSGGAGATNYSHKTCPGLSPGAGRDVQGRAEQ
jgi:hypothetical protein